MKLKNKVAVITGSASGIGRACALRFAEEGASIVIADIREGSATRDAIINKGGKAIVVATDVADQSSANHMVQAALDEFGAVDILMNNAGVFAELGRKLFMDITSEEWDRVLGINLKGMFHCCKAVYPRMKKQGRGKIINVSSAAVFMGAPHRIHYVASKGAVIAFTRALAREVGDAGITANVITPGLTLSESVRGNPQYPEEHHKAIIKARCIKRPEYPEDLAGAALFLASDDSDFISGQTINVDGGVMMH